MKNKLIWIVLVAGIIVAGVYWFCQQKAPDTDNKVKIASILPLTGPISAYGNDAMNGQKKAIEKLNSMQKDFQFELVVEDGKTGNKDAVNAYKKISLDKSINFLTAVSSNIAMPVLEDVKKDGILLFPGSSNPKINNPVVSNIFRHFVSAKQEAMLMLDSIPSNQISKTLPLIINDEFGMGFNTDLAATAKRMNKGQLLQTLWYEKQATNLNDYIAKIREAKPTNLILVGYKDFVANIVKQVQALKIPVNIYCSYSFLLTKAHEIAGSESVKGIRVVDLNIDTALLSANNLKLHEAVDFSTVYIMGTGIIGAKSKDKGKVIQYLESTNEIDCGVYKTKRVDHEFAPPIHLKKL